MSTTNEAKTLAGRYVKLVQWSNEDGCFVGTCPALFFGGVHGDDEVQVYRDLVAAVEDVIEGKLAGKQKLPEPTAGRKFSGKIPLRIAPELHAALVVQAESKRESLNRYIEGKLSDSGSYQIVGPKKGTGRTVHTTQPTRRLLV